jgi:hypothetical protein
MDDFCRSFWTDRFSRSRIDHIEIAVLAYRSLTRRRSAEGSALQMPSLLRRSRSRSVGVLFALICCGGLPPHQARAPQSAFAPPLSGTHEERGLPSR